VTEPRFYTRKQAPSFLTAQGFPISPRQFVKQSLPSATDPPQVGAWWGGKALYTPAELLRWAESRLRKSHTPTGFRGAEAAPIPVKRITVVEHTGSDAA
jgi:hypothetical protein